MHLCRIWVCSCILRVLSGIPSSSHCVSQTTVSKHHMIWWGGATWSPHLYWGISVTGFSSQPCWGVKNWTGHDTCLAWYQPNELVAMYAKKDRECFCCQKKLVDDCICKTSRMLQKAFNAWVHQPMQLCECHIQCSWQVNGHDLTSWVLAKRGVLFGSNCNNCTTIVMSCHHDE